MSRDLINGSKLIDVKQAAQYLLGCEIRRMLPDGTLLQAKIVETEAYHQEDPASHSFNGKSDRNSIMFGQPGYAYVYFTYGMHWCFNVTAGSKGYGAGILVRAVEPLTNIHVMQKNRHLPVEETVTKTISNGPAKLAQALAIGKELYGHDLTKMPLQIFEPIDRRFETVKTTRIGISRAVNEIARFYIKDSLFISKL